jgi:hypothetical protein
MRADFIGGIRDKASRDRVVTDEAGIRAGRQNCVENLQGDKNHLRRKTHVFVGRDIKKTFPRVFAYDALRQKLKTYVLLS